ncbi:Cna protein B-type domain protein [compost metagenome]
MVTDADGKAVFTDLLYGEYVLTETAAPQGYTIDSPNQTITIDSGVELTGGVLSITVTNSKTVDPGNPGNPDPGNPSNPDPGNPGNPWNPGTPTNPTNPKTPKEEVPTPTKPVDKDEEYTAPEEPVPSDGTNGDKTKPGKTSNPSDIELDENGNPLGGSKGDKAKQNGTNVPVLPKTGENSPWLVQVVGAVLIVAGAVMLRRKFLINKK